MWNEPDMSSGETIRRNQRASETLKLAGLASSCEITGLGLARLTFLITTYYLVLVNYDAWADLPIRQFLQSELQMNLGVMYSAWKHQIARKCHMMRLGNSSAL